MQLSPISPPHRLFISVGSNCDPETHFALALILLRAQFSSVVLSTIYQTTAVGFVGDDFWNAVIAATTDLSPNAVKTKLRLIEAECGRQRTRDKSAPRTMDLDLLLYDDWVDDTLQLPHPDIYTYGFVLGPLAELAPALVHPTAGETIQVLWNRFSGDKTLVPAVRWPDAPMD